jgi:uncharacterized protein DUF551
MTQVPIERLKELALIVPRYPEDDYELDDIASAIRELISLRERSEWQPIETAPRDGSSTLLFGRWASDEQGLMSGPVIGQFNYVRDAWEFANAGGWWRIRPTHWMPLPEPPQS